MANNRLYIVCRKCNSFTSLMKYYPPKGFIAGDQGWFVPDYTVGSYLDGWIQEHEEHAAELDYLSGEYFAFVTEQDKRVKKFDFVNSKILLKK